MAVSRLSIVKFLELSSKHSPSSLWVYYSMLRSTIGINDNIDIKAFQKLYAFLKRQNVGNVVKKSKVLSDGEYKTFLIKARDEKYLLAKVLTAVCAGLLYKNGMSGDLNTDYITTGTFVGYIIILFGGLSGHLMSSPITRRIDVFYCLLGCALFVASGALNIKHYENGWKTEKRDYGLAMASMAIINGVVFLIDSLLTWRGDY